MITDSEDIPVDKWNTPNPVFIKSIDGTKIATYSFNASSDLPPFLFVHGMGSLVPLNAPLLNYLAQFYQVFSYDQPGHGKSAQMTQYDLPSFSSVCEDVIRHFGLGQKPLIIMGHSMGGIIVADVAGRYQNFNIILSCPAGIVQRKQLGSKILASKVGDLIMDGRAAKKVILKNMWKLRNEIVIEILKEEMESNPTKFKNVQLGIIRQFPLTGNADVFLRLNNSIKVVLAKDDDLLNSQESKLIFQQVESCKHLIVVNSYHQITMQHPKKLSDWVVGKISDEQMMALIQ